MTAGIVANKDKDPSRTYTNKVRDFLEARGVTIVPDGQKADFWVVLGGDGTMLKASHQAAVLDVPLLGINLGNMGFLTDADKEDGFASLEKVLAGDYESQKRLMLVTCVASMRNLQNTPTHSDTDETDPELFRHDTGLALNEVFVGSATGGLANFSVFVNNIHMDDIRADGIIVATPTGSTAYNLSAGGPILAPYGDTIVITPVCPHSLSTRPWVIPATDKVRIVPGHPAALVQDGEKLAEIPDGCGIDIARAPVNCTIIKTTSVHFYEILRKKKIL